ncbi:MAG TPA: DinB family protein [Dehalococcoidia bacterium]|nr:DinB family protein [Dehalococcoidia bacterium]
MPGEREAQSFINAISGTVDAILACLDDLTVDEINWRPPVPAPNTLAIIAIHSQGNVAQNVLELLGGQEVDRVREEEFLTAGDVADRARQRWRELRVQIAETIAACDDATWDRELHHPMTDQMMTGRELLLLVHRHAAEHLGEAQMIKDLILVRRAG